MRRTPENLDTIKGEGWAAIVADLRGEALLTKARSVRVVHGKQA